MPSGHEPFHPAVRMVVVAAFLRDDGGIADAIYPVVALRPRPSGMMDCIVADPAAGLVGPAGEILNYTIGRLGPVACPWPIEDDAERLEPLIAILREFVARERDRRRAAPAEREGTHHG